jgi:hypothetical protein
MLASTLHGGIAKVRAIVISGSAYTPLKNITCPTPPSEPAIRPLKVFDQARFRQVPSVSTVLLTNVLKR